MELSAIVKENNVPLTRSERNLVSQMGTGTSAVSEDRYERQMKDLAAAREVAKQLPNRQTSERQSKMARAAMLKERLKMLRQMIPFLSPSAAKSLKAEMQQIAAQVASLGGGGTGGTSSAMTAAETPAVETSGAGDKAESPQDTMAQTSTTDQDGNEDQEGQNTSSESTAQGRTQNGGTSTAEDRQLNEAVEELRNLYKAVMAALKRKQQAGRGGGHQADLSPTLRVYAATPDSTESIVVKA